MNDKFDELAKGLAQFASGALLCLTVAAQLDRPAHANDFRLGPLIDLSDPDALAVCGSNGAEKDTRMAVNPVSPKNIAVVWFGGLAKGIVTAVSFDGGKKWQQSVVPGLTVCTGGSFDFVGDPWLTFAADGSLYVISLPGDGAVAVNKSSDGGLHWSAPVFLLDTTDLRFSPDQSSITADPVDARFVYAIWDNNANGNRGQAWLSRTTDGGRTWEPPRVIYDASVADRATTGHQILVLPNGSLVDLFNEFKYSNAGTHEEAALSVIRSTDRGLTWSSPLRVASVSSFFVTDPDTGHLVANSGYPPPLFAAAIDANSGDLYAVWEDLDFSGGHYSSIALSMSSDGGFNWSAPIQVNCTPTNITPANRQAFLPSVAVAADGTVAVAYYDFRFNDANAGALTDRWLVHCHRSVTTTASNPASWGNEVRLTDASFDIENAPIPLGYYFLGDYQGLTSVGNDFLAAWSQPYGTDNDSVFFRRVGP